MEQLVNIFLITFAVVYILVSLHQINKSLKMLVVMNATNAFKKSIREHLSEKEVVKEMTMEEFFEMQNKNKNEWF